MRDRLRPHRPLSPPETSSFNPDARKESLLPTWEPPAAPVQPARSEAGVPVQATDPRPFGFDFGKISILPPGTDVSPGSPFSPVQRDGPAHIQPRQLQWPGERVPMERLDMQLRLAGHRHQDRGGEREPVTIQRLGAAAGSDPTLTAQYTFLLGSVSFQELNTAVTTNQNINLVDSTATQATDYSAATHTIQVPVRTAVAPAGAARPLADVREDILWEMHNARNKGAHGRTNLRQAAVPNASMEDKRLYSFRVAALALAMEWDEWIRVAEHDTRAAQINANMAGGAGAHVTRSFSPNYAVADAGWFLFATYLQTQIATGHTAFYDPLAANADWKGKKVLKLVQSGSPKTLQIAQKQVQDWTSGKTTNIKSAGTNPFKSDAIAKEASRGA